MAQHASVLQRQSLTPDPQLARFFGVRKDYEQAVLFLPRFTGTVKLDSQGSGGVSLRYPGHTFSDRDTRAAFYVQALLGSVFDPSRIRIENASGTDSSHIDALGAKTVFLFGSRSNPLTQWALANRAPAGFLELKYGPSWTICARDGQSFSAPDPSQVNESDYRAHPDYGVLARFFDPHAEMSFFVLAGLGGRATEGCGHYLAANWLTLSEEFAEEDFAVILKFSPPVEPGNYERVAHYSLKARKADEAEQMA
jgi:hypothetical protein